MTAEMTPESEYCTVGLKLDEDVIDDLLYAARTNNLPDLMTELPQTAVSNNTTKAKILEHAIDPNSGNNAAHFASANGHIEILRYLAEVSDAESNESVEVPPESILQAANASGSTPLHYAALNGQLGCVKLLVQKVKDKEGRKNFVEAKNAAGHDAAWEAETASKEDCVNWLLGSLDEGDTEKEFDDENQAVNGTQEGTCAKVNGDRTDAVEDGVKALKVD